MTIFPAPDARTVGNVVYALAFMLMLCVAPASESFAQTIDLVTVEKGIAYVQTSATAVQVDPKPQGPNYGGPYDFSVAVVGQNIGGITAPTFTGPINFTAVGSWYNDGKLVYSNNDASSFGWGAGPNGGNWGSPTLSDLNSKFGSGTYTVTVNGASIPLQLTGDAYPNAPLLTLNGGAWSNGKYFIDPGKPLTVTTNAFTAYGTHQNGRIAIFVEEVGEVSFQLFSAVPGTNFLSYTLPASTFVSGKEYGVAGAFAALVDVNTNPALPGNLKAAHYSAFTRVAVSAASPVFPMVISGSITPTVANITADIQYRPDDIDKTKSVYVFALAPKTLVKNSVITGKHLGPFTNATAKDTPLPCVLAQLTSSGQLTAASSSSLEAYVTGVLGSEGASINVLNGVSTPLIQGSVFYVGYGPNSQAMIDNGINRSAVTVPGPQVCQPQAPQTGWWWNKNEGGRGFSIETQDNHLFMAGYLYDASGRATWMTSGGLTSLDGSFYNSSMLSYANGQTLTGAYKAPVNTASPGQITLSFNDARNGTLIWPGGAIAIERFDSQLPPSTNPPPAFAPENGWWWNKDESGRGYFLEFKDSFAFMAGYMYDASGNPLWYLSSGTMPVQQTFQGSWTQFANGQTMTGAYKPPSPINGNVVGALSIQFQDTTNATMTLPNGTQLPITRFKF